MKDNNVNEQVHVKIKVRCAVDLVKCFYGRSSAEYVPASDTQGKNKDSGVKKHTATGLPTLVQA